jgi:hypothetical protein
VTARVAAIVRQTQIGQIIGTSIGLTHNVVYGYEKIFVFIFFGNVENHTIVANFAIIAVTGA